MLTIILRSDAALVLYFNTRQDAQEKVDALWTDYAIGRDEFRRLSHYLAQPDAEAQP